MIHAIDSAAPDIFRLVFLIPFDTRLCQKMGKGIQWP